MKPKYNQNKNIKISGLLVKKTQPCLKLHSELPSIAKGFPTVSSLQSESMDTS